MIQMIYQMRINVRLIDHLVLILIGDMIGIILIAQVGFFNLKQAMNLRLPWMIGSLILIVQLRLIEISTPGILH